MNWWTFRTATLWRTVAWFNASLREWLWTAAFVKTNTKCCACFNTPVKKKNHSTNNATQCKRTDATHLLLNCYKIYYAAISTDIYIESIAGLPTNGPIAKNLTRWVYTLFWLIGLSSATSSLLSILNYTFFSPRVCSFVSLCLPLLLYSRCFTSLSCLLTMLGISFTW